MPTLGGSALIVLAILLAVIAFRIMRTQEHKGVNMVVTLIAVTALVSGVGGVNLVSNVWAPPSGMTDPEGGEVRLNPVPNNVPNMTGVPQKVLNVVANDPDCSIGGEYSVEELAAPGNGGGGELMCAQNPTVPPNESCTVFLACLM